ncbi:MAG: type II toxin-antitoxin system VapC family toxin [Betaproteobacteria bacterium]|jgi:predicted nucleic acid-binding protein|nr:type II toxin-antitoxin system VapC family toxin [Betaproteobacteria bacterium]
MYLLDTNVVSELRRPKPNERVRQWLQQASPSELFISAVTVGEIQSGIEITREQDQEKAAAIEVWLDQVMETSQIIGLDAHTFRIWARLMHRQSNTVIEDALIAASAIANQLTVVTRNIGDFERFGLKVVNPFIAAA